MWRPRLFAQAEENPSRRDFRVFFKPTAYGETTAL